VGYLVSGDLTPYVYPGSAEKPTNHAPTNHGFGEVEPLDKSTMTVLTLTGLLELDYRVDKGTQFQVY
jgi:hypothetical protein